MQTALVRLFGWRVLPLGGDPTLHDRWRWVRRRLRTGPVRTLDAGSGTGNIAISAARARRNEVLGLSYTGPWNELARARASLTGATSVRIEDFDLGDLAAAEQRLGRFEQILCLEVIEHIEEDARLVRDLARLLEPGGRLLLTAPTAEHRPLVDEEARNRVAGGHVRWGYTRERIEEIVASAELDLVELGAISGVVSQALVNLTRRVGRRLGHPVAWVAVLPLRTLQLLDRPLTRLTRGKYLSIAAVAVRRAD